MERVNEAVALEPGAQSIDQKGLTLSESEISEVEAVINGIYLHLKRESEQMHNSGGYMSVQDDDSRQQLI